MRTGLIWALTGTINYTCVNNLKI